MNEQSGRAAVELETRRASAADRSAILDVCRISLGWEAGDPNEAFFAWKHDENAFGASPTWVAVDPDGRVLGVRCFMRWRFRDRDGRVLQAVRAVDTATHPDARGLGIFTRLTLGALPGLEADGVAFVFNTPNEKSRPGYLKMGWSLVGQVPLGVQPGRLRLRRSAASAWSGSDKWGIPTEVGLDPADALSDDDAVARLLARRPDPGRIHTDLEPAVLRWRYGFGPLGYRVYPVGDRIEDGLVAFRLRSRGGRLDATVCDELLPRRRPLEGVYRRLARDTGADLVLRSQTALLAAGPFVGVRRWGQLLTWKPLARPGVPTLDELALSYGDLELF